jgi:hypothetical protein
MKRERYIICPCCGEKEEFTRTVWGTLDYTEYRSIDNHGEVIEVNDSDYDNYNQTDQDPIECNKCSTQVMEFEGENFENEYIEFVCTHTDTTRDKEGEWIEDGCELNKELKNKMEAELLAEKIGGEQE